jgi:hypothetical protein
LDHLIFEAMWQQAVVELVKELQVDFLCLMLLIEQEQGRQEYSLSALMELVWMVRRQ